MAEVATDSHFLDVSKVLDPDDLQHFYVKLGLEHRDITHAEVSAGTTDSRLKATAVLRQWKKTRGKKATQQAILQALQECDFLDAREELQVLWSNQGKVYFFRLSMTQNSQNITRENKKLQHLIVSNLAHL